jgi:hypothetical protein
MIKMKEAIILLLICFISCKSQNKTPETFLMELVDYSINIIGNDVPDTYSHVSGHRFSRIKRRDAQNKPEIYITLVANSNIVNTVDLTLVFEEPFEALSHYRQLIEILDKEQWEYVQFISAFKFANGQLRYKDGIFLGVFEPDAFSIPISLSIDKTLGGFYIYDINHENKDFSNPFIHAFNEMNKNPPKKIHSIEFYKNKIIEYRDHFDWRQEITTIVEADNIIPNALTFFIAWRDNHRGFIYELYTFDENKNVSNKYFIGSGAVIDRYVEIIMYGLHGNRIENELVSIGDFSNNGINEILTISFYPNIGYVFSIFGFNPIENDFIRTLFVPIYINFENPFPPVEFVVLFGNAFRVFEVIDDEYLEFSWNIYRWNNIVMEYIKY